MNMKQRQNELALHWQKHHDDASMMEIISTFEGMIVLFINKTRKFSGLSDEDARSSAITGIIVAVESFDPSRGDLPAVVYTRIRERVLEDATRNATILSFPKSKSERFGRIRGWRIYNEAVANGMSTNEALQHTSEKIGVDKKILEGIFSSKQMGASDDQDIADFLDSNGLVTAFSTDTEIARCQQRRIYLEVVAKVLINESERTRETFIGRYFSKPEVSIEHMSNKYGVSRQRIIDQHRQVVDRIRDELKRRKIGLDDIR